MRLHFPVDLTGNLIMIEKFVLAEILTGDLPIFLRSLMIIIIIIIWFGDTVTVSHSTKCDTNSKVRALS